MMRIKLIPGMAILLVSNWATAQSTSEMRQKKARENVEQMKKSDEIIRKEEVEMEEERERDLKEQAIPPRSRIHPDEYHNFFEEKQNDENNAPREEEEFKDKKSLPNEFESFN